MLSINLIYENVYQLKSDLEKRNVSFEKEYIVRIYTSAFDKEVALFEAGEIKKLLPNSQITGASTNYIIYNGEIFADKTLIIVEQYTKAVIKCNIFDWEDKSAATLSKEIIDSIEGYNVQMVRILFGGYYDKTYDFLESFGVLNSSIKLVGGLAGETKATDITPFVFNDTIVMVKGVATLAICGEVYTHIAANTAQEIVGSLATVTHLVGNYIDKINDTNAVEWIKENVGISELEEYDTWEKTVTSNPFAKFSLILEDRNGASRFLKFNDKENKMSLYFTTIPSGTKFRMGYISPKKCVEECYNICLGLQEIPIESIFYYGCLFRKLYLEEWATWESSPFKEYNICGAFLLGEICWINGQNQLLNGSSILNTVAEEEVYINPDMSVFNKLNEMQDKSNDILQFLLKKHNFEINEENQLLMNKLNEKQTEMDDLLTIDYSFNAYNIIKYRNDKDIYDYDTLCMIQFKNTDVLIACVGQDEYIHQIRSIINQIREYLAKNYSFFDSMLYVINDRTFVLATRKKVSRDNFLHMIENLHKKFKMVSTFNKSAPVVSRYGVVFDKGDLVEKAFRMFEQNSKSQVSLLIAGTDNICSDIPKIELKMIGIINRALRNDGVIPYYQGIHNNISGAIEIYEALMRLDDAEGNIYAPIEFMDIAKKYHLYLHISKKMIEKVFYDFGDKDVEFSISINLSAHDIESKDFRVWLFNRLSYVKNSHNFSFEILEDEKFEKNNMLMGFIEEVRKFGCRISIDDFGAGYSNLLEIIKLKPDFIKIDGSIIKDIHLNNDNKTILKAIVEMAKSLNIGLVAEFVENSEIQEVIKEIGILYSQGYYFSKPSTITSLGLM